MKLPDKLKKALEFLVKTIPKDVYWALSNGSAAFLYGGKREPTDIDIGTDKDGINKIVEVLKLDSPKWVDKGIFYVYVAKAKIEGYEIEFWSEAVIRVNGKEYNRVVDEEVITRTKKVRVDNLEIPVSPPEDVVASKAITQRSIESGKGDIEDIQAIMDNQNIDWKYLEERANRMNGYDRIIQLLRDLGYSRTD